MKANQKPRDFKRDTKASFQTLEVIFAIIFMVVGFAIVSVLTVFTTTLSGQVYQQTQDEILEIDNETVRNYVNESIMASFESQAQVSDYLPLIALAVIITLVITLVVSGIAGQFFGGGMIGGGGYGRGGLL